MFERYGTGTTIWSALCGGLLTGKYMDFAKKEVVLPEGSRFSTDLGMTGQHGGWMKSNFPQDDPEKTKKSVDMFCQLKEIADGLECSMAQLALAWVLK